ncbi:MAG TPA: Gfo/Idh/MocA family oxidoreductase [Candidatus Acidoferrales bacterium]|jgi:predicted dehydrogenase|nr:Gfo/Idh/MocA family oxidoreductase [Candidatus Acidoferrales bacterium]
MNYAIIGCGLIGKKRLAALPAGSKVVVACDTNLERAKMLVELAKMGRAVTDFKEAVADAQVNAVIVATINSTLAEISAAAIRAGKHVIVEKPAGISVKEIDELITLEKKYGVCVRVGFNHRFHPAFIKAREIFDSGVMGELMFIRARYGHGGRVGYDREWRADPKLAGGGELVDQGIHLIDLAGWFLGEFKKIDGHVATYFWDMPVDDNAFLDLQTAKGQTAWLHVSCTEWKNLFSFEIYGRHTKLHIDGLGGSYGVEKLFHYQMKPEMGIPDTKVYEFPRPDESWKTEMNKFEADIQSKSTPDAGLAEVRAALQVVEAIYKQNPKKL